MTTTTKEKSKIKITINMVEGDPSQDLGELVCDSFEEANIRLRDHAIRHNAPKRGCGYLKTDLQVKVGSLEWEFGYDMVQGGAASHELKIFPDLKSHFINSLRFYAGLKRPSHMTDKQYHDFIEDPPYQEHRNHAKKILSELGVH